ncbi:MAG: hypothetical protein ACRC10_08695 [Thermoguttaceae bacterium]
MLAILNKLNRHFLFSRLLLVLSLEVSTLFLALRLPLNPALLFVLLLLSLIPLLKPLLKPVSPQKRLTELLRQKNASPALKRLGPAALDFELHPNQLGSPELRRLVMQNAIPLLRQLLSTQKSNQKLNRFSSLLLCLSLLGLAFLALSSQSIKPTLTQSALFQATPNQTASQQPAVAESEPTSPPKSESEPFPQTVDDLQSLNPFLKRQQQLLQRTTREWIETRGQSLLQLSPQKQRIQSQLAQIQEQLAQQFLSTIKTPDETFTPKIAELFQQSANALKKNRLGQSMQTQRQIVQQLGGDPDVITDDLPLDLLEKNIDNINRKVLAPLLASQNSWEKNTDSAGSTNLAGTTGSESLHATQTALIEVQTNGSNDFYGSHSANWGELPSSQSQAVPIMPQNTVVPKYREPTERYFERWNLK